MKAIKSEGDHIKLNKLVIFNLTFYLFFSLITYGLLPLTSSEQIQEILNTHITLCVSLRIKGKEIMSATRWEDKMLEQLETDMTESCRDRRRFYLTETQKKDFPVKDNKQTTTFLISSMIN